MPTMPSASPRTPSGRPRTAARRFAVASAGAALGLMALATPAVAHVTVQPGIAEQGAFSKISFRVPNERDASGTTKVEVFMPTDHPLASVQVKPVPGWTVQVEKTALAKPLDSHGKQITEAVSKITWSGGTIAPGQFQEFDVSGRMPTGTDTLIFKAIQTYANGEVVRWIDLPQPGGAEPEHPAPILKLTKAGAAQGGQAATHGAGHSGEATLTATAGAVDGDPDRAARALGAAGIAVGILGTGIGVVALRRAGQRQ